MFESHRDLRRRRLQLMAILVGLAGVLGACRHCCTPERTTKEPLESPMCDRSSFFVEVKEGTKTPCLDFGAKLAARLTTTFYAEACASSDPWMACQPPQSYAARVTPVMAKRPAANGCLDHDGYYRFFRVSFTKNGRALEIPPERLCRTVEMIRAEAGATTNTGGACTEPVTCSTDPNDPNEPNGGSSTVFSVGRDCPAVPWNMASQATPSMLDWPREVLGAPAVGNEPTSSTAIVVVDTGIPVDPTFDRAGPADDPPRHLHGQAMAKLIRSVHSKAAVVSYRVFNAKGHASTASLAAALEDIAAGSLEDQRKIVNLSLGWPPELSYVRHLDDLAGGHSCESYEDGIGESVKFALGLLRRPVNGTPAMVIAASGNRPAPPLSVIQGARIRSFGVCGAAAGASTKTPSLVGLSCRGKIPNPELRDIKEMYYPAQWAACPAATGGRTVGQPSNCWLTADPRTRKAAFEPLAIAVAATAWTGRLASFSERILGSARGLAAPGQHVYVQGLEGAVAAPGNCAAAQAAGRAHFTPHVMSGTSVAAALTSAAAALVQDSISAAGRRLLTQDEMAAYLWLTGRPVKAHGELRVPWLCRALACLGTPACVNPIYAHFDANIGSSLDVLQNYESDVLSQPMGGCVQPALARTDVVLPAYPAQDDMCDSIELGLTQAMDNPLAVDWPAAGVLGPQPSGGSCPPCIIPNAAGPQALAAGTAGEFNAQSFDIIVELNSQYEAGTYFKSADIGVMYDDGRLVQQTLATGTNPGGVLGDPWVPGNQFKVTVTNLPVVVNANIVAVELYLQVMSPTGGVTWDVSPIMIP